MQSHKNIFAFYAVVGMFLWIVSSVCYISKASTETGGFGTIWVPYVQLVSFIFNTVTLAMLSVAISDGIPALYDKKDVCPNKQTGLLSLYETFFAVYIGIILVVAMHIMEEARNKWYPYVESAADTTPVETTAYSCNSHHYSP
jgi:hypothetical protein